MKKYFLSAVAAAMLLLSNQNVKAQEEDDDLIELQEELSDAQERAEDAQEMAADAHQKAAADHDKMRKEYEEIIIKRKQPGKDGKVTIEIRGDDVIVNGKPIDQYTDEALAVIKRMPKRYSLTYNNSPFRGMDHPWLMEQGTADFEGDRPFLGVSTESAEGGAKVISVSEKSAAQQAGLKKDDIITKVNETSVKNQEELTNAISKFKPEEKITITYKRNGKESKATATLGKRKIMANRVRPRVPVAPEPPIPPMDFNFENGELGRLFSYGGRQRLGIKAQDTEDGKGVKVLDVDEGSAAEKAGVKENDVITAFEGKDVKSADELAQASRNAKDKTSVKIQLKRNGKTENVEIKVPRKLKTANL